MKGKCIVFWVLVSVVPALFFSGCSGGDDGADSGATDNSVPTNTPDSTSLGGPDESMRLPAGYESDTVLRAGLNGLGCITQSKGGMIFIRHKNANGDVRISSVNADTKQIQTIVTLPGEKTSPFIAGGPLNTCFVGYDNEVRQYAPDGSYEIWGRNLSGHPFYFSSSGELICYQNDAFVSHKSDGTSRTIASGFGIDDDCVMSNDGTAYIADTANGVLYKVDSSGNRAKLADIAPDPTHLEFDSSGKLFIDNITSGFSSVDTITGALSNVSSETVGCSIAVPADFVIDDSNRAIFATWTGSQMFWFNMDSGDGGALFQEDWANTNNIAMGPDDALYMAVTVCSAQRSSKIVRITPDGSPSTYLDGIQGEVGNLAFNSSGVLYMTVHRNEQCEWYYISPDNHTLTRINLKEDPEIISFDIDPVSGNIFANTHLDDPSTIGVLEIANGEILNTYTISLPKEVVTVRLLISPDGKFYAFAEEKERWATGPVVERYIFSIDLNTETGTLLAQVDLNGCCPLTNASIDGDGNIWWVLNPDFCLYRISPTGEKTLFAENIPVDTGAVFKTSTGDLLFNYSDGILRVYKDGK